MPGAVTDGNAVIENLTPYLGTSNGKPVGGFFRFAVIPECFYWESIVTLDSRLRGNGGHAGGLRRLGDDFAEVPSATARRRSFRGSIP